jgi:cysteinyl-tRNA synthetase
LISEGDATPLEGDASPFTEAFVEAMDDDFNTPEALAALQGLARELNVAKTSGDRSRAGVLASQLRRLGSLLGILQLEPGTWLATRSELTGGVPADAPVVDAPEIERLLRARIDARKAKNWTESDRIRDDLAARGVLLEDSPSGTTWRWK